MDTYLPFFFPAAKHMTQITRPIIGLVGFGQASNHLSFAYLHIAELATRLS
jgi:hypothetical protein